MAENPNRENELEHLIRAIAAEIEQLQKDKDQAVAASDFSRAILRRNQIERWLTIQVVIERLSESSARSHTVSDLVEYLLLQSDEDAGADLCKHFRPEVGK